MPVCDNWLRSARAGNLVNELQQVAVLCEQQAGIAVAEDPDDDFLLGVAVAGHADYLVTGDRRAGLCWDWYGFRGREFSPPEFWSTRCHDEGQGS